MASRVIVHPWPWSETGPYFYGPWKEEFNSRASWGKHPAAAGPGRAKHDGEYGPSIKQGFHSEHHPGDDYE